MESELMRHNPENASEIVHVPVLWREILDFTGSSAGAGKGLLVDCTLGEGGHSSLFLSEFPELKIIAFERDPEILAVARRRLAPFDSRITYVNRNFADMPAYLRSEGLMADYVLFDYGISSYHFDRSGRGFSFRGDEPLDMRLGVGCSLSAADIVNRAKEEELARIFFEYGEERWSRRIASYIVRKRESDPFETAGQLADLVMKAIPARFHVRNIHPATRVFQALRIAVNGELDAISSGLDSLYKNVAKDGLVMCMSFHSLEDRIVKNVFRQWARGCSCGLEPRDCRCTDLPFVNVETKKPVVPSEDEILENSRARSAKLRVCRRLG